MFKCDCGHPKCGGGQPPVPVRYEETDQRAVLRREFHLLRFNLGLSRKVRVDTLSGVKWCYGGE